MEPMHIGSSPSSPTTNPNYLPAYLMGGESQVSHTPNTSTTSPGRNKTPTLRGPPAIPGPSLRQKLFNQSLNDYSLLQSSPAEKTGPPKQGLFDAMDKPNVPILSSTVKPTCTDSQTFVMENTMMDTVDGMNESISMLSQLPNDSMNNFYPNESSQHLMRVSSSVNAINTNWVTVFGFYPKSLNLILTHMANCGIIVEKKFPSQGNWIHLKFSNYREVANALILNGKLIANTLMIGVIPFYPTGENSNKENLEASVNFTSPTRARSLRNSNVSQLAANNVVSPQNVPQKSTGIVTKAMEYVFGW